MMLAVSQDAGVWLCGVMAAGVSDKPRSVSGMNGGYGLPAAGYRVIGWRSCQLGWAQRWDSVAGLVAA